MKEKVNVSEFGCNDILSEMEKLQVFGGGIGGDGNTHEGCTHNGCIYNNGCSNSGCGTDNDCVDVRCQSFQGCNIEPHNPYGECV